jgi:hypothetical protein
MKILKAGEDPRKLVKEHDWMNKLADHKQEYGLLSNLPRATHRLIRIRPAALELTSAALATPKGDLPLALDADGYLTAMVYEVTDAPECPANDYFTYINDPDLTP